MMRSWTTGLAALALTLSIAVPTVAGTTTRVKNIVPGTDSSSPHGFTKAAGTVLFLIGSDLWKTDGTAEGTTLLRAGVSPRGLTAFDGAAYFSAEVRDDKLGRELWKSDGSVAGTSL